MKGYEDNTPNAAKLLESLRSSGYDNYTAICDIIDNSFDANADIVKVEIGEAGVSRDKSYIISISDNGCGMPPEILDQAMRLGSLTSRQEEDLGKYGMGLITASISLGRRLTVISKYNGKFYTAIQDLDEVSDLNKFVKTVRESNEAEITRFKEIFGAAESGTIITVQKVDNIHNKNMGAFKAKLKKDCGQIYRYFLNSNKKLFINGAEVRPIDPMLIDNDGTEVLLDTTGEIIGDNNEPTSIRLRIVLLPRTSEQESRLMDINQVNQGFYLIRNFREIASGQSLSIFKKHNRFNRFRAEVFFTSALDKKMGTDFTKGGGGAKDGFGLFDDARNWIERNAFPQIQAIGEICDRDKKIKEEKIDHKSSSKIIENKASILRKPRLDKDNISDDLMGASSKTFTNVEFSSQSNTRLAPLFQYEILGKKIQIKYNNDHPFYQQVFKKILDDPDMIDNIDYIFYSATLALIEITGTKDKEYLRDEFIDRFSDNLRALLS